MAHTLQITRRDMASALGTMRQVKGHAERAQARTEMVVGHGVQMVVAGAGGLGAGVITGRYGNVSVGPVPAELLAGLVSVGAGAMGWAGKASPYLASFGEGLVAFALGKWGVALGSSWRAKATGSISGNSMGDGGWDPNALGAVSESEIQTMLQQQAMAQGMY
jgi:hypothetical protein